MAQLYVYDPTITDKLSKVRGIGRYVQLLTEAFESEAKVVGAGSDLPWEATFINPFINFLEKPPIMNRYTHKQIAVIHDLIPLKYPNAFPTGLKGRIKVMLNKMSLKHYDTIVTDSEASKKDIVEMLEINPQKIVVIYPAIKDAFLKTSKIQDLASSIYDYCIYVGDATWNKNIYNMACAVKDADVKCVCIGKVFNQLDADLSHPWLRELSAFNGAVKGDDRFIFPGFISDEELVSYYKNATVNLLVSRDEGYGFSYFEAASQGTPSILADRSIFHETAGDTALYADPEHYHSIADKIKQVFADKKLRNDLGEKAKKHVEPYNLQHFKSAWEKVLA